MLIRVITHGDVFNGPNPKHTPKGREQVKLIKEYIYRAKCTSENQRGHTVSGYGDQKFIYNLPTIDAIGVGLAARHGEMLDILFEGDQSKCIFSSIVGRSTYKDKATGKILLADGRSITLEKLIDVPKETTKDFILNQPDGILFLAGKPFLKALLNCFHHAFTVDVCSASLYLFQIEFDRDGERDYVLELIFHYQAPDSEEATSNEA